MIEDLKQRLNRYYQEQEIHPMNFHCKHYLICKGTCDNFTEGKMPDIGERYMEGILPRLLVISLDPPEGTDNPLERLIGIGTPTDKVELHKNKHWYLTHELIWIILKR